MSVDLPRRWSEADPRYTALFLLYSFLRYHQQHMHMVNTYFYFCKIHSCDISERTQYGTCNFWSCVIMYFYPFKIPLLFLSTFADYHSSIIEEFYGHSYKLFRTTGLAGCFSLYKKNTAGNSCGVLNSNGWFNNPLPICVCVEVCDFYELLLLFRVCVFQTAFRIHDASSFHGTNLRVAFSFSKLLKLVRRCYRVRLLELFFSPPFERN